MSEMTIKSFVQKSIDKYLQKRQSLCKTRENSNFLEKDKIVILVKI